MRVDIQHQSQPVMAVSLRGGRNSNRCGRACRDAGRSTLHLDIAAAVAGVALDLIVLLVFFVAALSRGRSRLLNGWLLGGGLGRCSPAGNLPDDTGEALEGEVALGPFTARLARAVEGAEAGVDSTLVGLGAELVGGTEATRAIGVDGAVVTVLLVLVAGV